MELLKKRMDAVEESLPHRKRSLILSVFSGRHEFKKKIDTFLENPIEISLAQNESKSAELKSYHMENFIFSLEITIAFALVNFSHFRNSIKDLKNNSLEYKHQKVRLNPGEYAKHPPIFVFTFSSRRSINENIAAFKKFAADEYEIAKKHEQDLLQFREKIKNEKK